MNIINNLGHSGVVHETTIPATNKGTRKAIKVINTVKAPGLDGNPVEVLLYGGNGMARRHTCPSGLH